MKIRLLRGLAVVALAVAAAIGPGTPAWAESYEPITGSGSTWSALAIRQWTADVASAHMSVSYTDTGSSAGRRDFAQGLTHFAVSEIPFQGVDPTTGQADTANGRPYAYMPVVAGGTAFMYHLKINGKLYRDLRLSGDTIAKIFTGAIKDWSDDAITKDNNGAKLPSKRIVPVVRSDGSGTTAQFTTWMSKQHRTTWCNLYPKCGLTSYYPAFGNAVAQSGSGQVASYISAQYGEGTIGYVEHSYAEAVKFPVAKVLNAAGYFVEPTANNVAVALTKARINTDKNSQDYLTQVLDDVYTYQDARVYPLSSYSYMILPTSVDRRLTKESGRTLGAFAYYFLCKGQQSVGNLGLSPLPLNLVRAGFEQVARVPGAEGIAFKPEGCNNPTFDPANPNNNRLAQIAEQPPACAKVGQGPCGQAVASLPRSGPGAPAAGGAPGAQAPGGAVGPSAPAAAPGAAGPAAAGVDPVTGELLAAEDGQTGAGTGALVEVASASGGLAGSLGLLVVAEFLLLMIVPVFLARMLARRRDPLTGTVRASAQNHTTPKGEQ